jgi:hypothetical protein
MTISGWCQSAPGTRPDTQHDECQRRLDKGLLALCSCPNHDEKEDS